MARLEFDVEQEARTAYGWIRVNYPDLPPWEEAEEEVKDKVRSATRSAIREAVEALNRALTKARGKDRGYEQETP